MQTLVDLKGERELLELAAEIAEQNQAFVQALLQRELEELEELRNLIVHKNCFGCNKTCSCQVCLAEQS